jgi:metal-sulfur cluster biosynthetic enzyme
MKRKKLLIQIGVIIIFCAILIILISLPHLFLKVNKVVTKSYPFTKEGIKQALKTIKDPELDINIVELGLVRDIQIGKNNKVKISNIFTTPLCPLNNFIAKQIEETVKANFDVPVEVTVDKSISWNMDMMTEEGKKKLSEGSPPEASKGSAFGVRSASGMMPLA